MEEKREKLLDWGFLAIARHDLAAADTLFKQYAEKVRSYNPRIAFFYENLLTPALQTRMAPSSVPAKLSIPHAGTETVNLSLDAIDDLLVAALPFLAKDSYDVKRYFIYLLTCYGDLLQMELRSAAESPEGAIGENLERLHDITEKLRFVISRLIESTQRKGRDLEK